MPFQRFQIGEYAVEVPSELVDPYTGVPAVVQPPLTYKELNRFFPRSVAKHAEAGELDGEEATKLTVKHDDALMLAEVDHYTDFDAANFASNLIGMASTPLDKYEIAAARLR